MKSKHSRQLFAALGFSVRRDPTANLLGTTKSSASVSVLVLPREEKDLFSSATDVAKFYE
jgi:hypothetical protein